LTSLFEFLIIRWREIIATAFLGYCIFLVASFIDDEVSQGAAYGFVIGMSKQQVFDVAKELYKNQNVYLAERDSASEEEIYISPYKKLTFTNNDFLDLSLRTYWTLNFSKRFTNYLELYFDEDNNLVKILRHRKYFELP